MDHVLDFGILRFWDFEIDAYLMTPKSQNLEILKYPWHTLNNSYFLLPFRKLSKYCF